MKATITTAILSCLVTVLPVNVRAKGEPEKPNVVIILADDMGFSDAGCYGGEIQTPNLDRLAAGGLRFTQFYNTSRCWPTRASILTGYYPQQVRRDALPDMEGGTAGKRPAWARLLPELLRPLGYRSYHSGKWHVDGKVLDGGFDASYSLNDHDRNFNPRQHTLNDVTLPRWPRTAGIIRRQPLHNMPSKCCKITTAATAGSRSSCISRLPRPISLFKRCPKT